MGSNFPPPENVAYRLRWLMLSRVAIVTFLLGIAAFVEVQGMGDLSEISASALFRTILLTYILSIAYVPLLRYLPGLAVNLYVQSVLDLALITAVVHGTGGIQSIYSVLYPLVIIYAVLFLGRKGGLIIASVAGLLYAFAAGLDSSGGLPPLFSPGARTGWTGGGYLFTRILTHLFSFYLIAFLTSFVVEQERRTRSLLAEKQNAFDELDILYRSIIDSVDTGILTINREGRVRSFNPAASEITGLAFGEVDGRPLADLFPEIHRFVTGQETPAKKADLRTRFETTHRRADGERLILGGAVSPLRDPAGAVIGEIVIFQNLTAINEMRASLEKSRRLAFVGGMAASLAHEIRNPLASIGGSIQMLCQDLPPTDTNRRLMQIILRGKEQLEGFLKDFLLMSRPLPGVCEPVDLGAAIREVIESLRCVPEWPDRLETAESLPDGALMIQANRVEVRQVLWNVLQNALQAMPDGGRLGVEASWLRRNDTGGVEIRISDTGCGIREEELERVFEPFYTTRDVGTGLGLAVVQRILDGYGGTIGLEPGGGGGTTCRIWFPAQQGPPGPTGAGS